MSEFADFYLGPIRSISAQLQIAVDEGEPPEELAARRAARDELIASAFSEGVGASALAHAAGLMRQAIYVAVARAEGRPKKPAAKPQEPRPIGSISFTKAIDLFCEDMRNWGKLSSAASEAAYRKTLVAHAEDIGNRHPSYTGREDVKKTLRRWKHPNTQGNRRAILVSFYDYWMEEGHRKDNPARQTRRPRKRQAQVYRLTLAETRKLLAAAKTSRERRAIYLGVCAGLRSRELRGLQGRHFDRPGWVWVSKDIAKGGRERWVPVLPDLEDVWEECRGLGHDSFVLPAQRVWNLEPDRAACDIPGRGCSHQTLWRLVERVGRRAGIAAHIHPHLLRHAFGDHIARFAGMRNAQFLLGHADIATTETYTGTPTLDELAASIRGFSFGENTNVGSSPEPTVEYLQEYRHGDSNPGLSPLSNLMRDLFRSPVVREAAQRMGAPSGR